MFDEERRARFETEYLWASHQQRERMDRYRKKRKQKEIFIYPFISKK